MKNNLNNEHTMKTHTTKGGDSFMSVRNHIIGATPWTRKAYRPPAKPQPADRASDLVTMFSALAGVGALLLIAYHISK